MPRPRTASSTASSTYLDTRPIEAWAAENGVTISPDANILDLLLFNPGRGNTFTLDLNVDGTYEDVALSKRSSASRT